MATVTMTRGRQLRELVDSDAARVDAKAGVLYGVKILGFQSRNGRTYTRRALEKAAHLYEGISVYVNHPGRAGGDRDVKDKIGWLERVKLTDDGLRGNLHLLLSHPQTPQILEAAVKNPALLGLSHNAVGALVPSRRPGEESVEEIERVFSVDLVADPASTAGLFESVQMDESRSSTYEHLLAEAKRHNKPSRRGEGIVRAF
jgi:hypothetical protein